MTKQKVITALIVSILFISIFFIVRYLTHPYNIGIILSPDSSIGQEENLAAHFYSKKLKPIGLHKTKLIIKSPSLEEKSIRTACRELIEEHASVVIGGSLSYEGLIIYDELKNSGIPFWGVTTSSDILSNRKDNFFRFIIPVDKIGSIYGKLLDRNKHTNILIIKSKINQSYSSPFAEALSKNFSGTTESIFYDTDFTSHLHSDQDAVVCILSATNLMQVIKYTRRNYPENKIYSTDWGFDELLSLFSGPELDGVVAITRRNRIEEKYLPLYTEFGKTMNTHPTYGAVTVFAIINTVHEALTAVGTDKKKLIKYFNERQTYNTGYGSCYMNRYGDPVYTTLNIREIINNRPVFINPLTIEDDETN